MRVCVLAKAIVLFCQSFLKGMLTLIGAIVYYQKQVKHFRSNKYVRDAVGSREHPLMHIVNPKWPPRPT